MSATGTYAPSIWQKELPNCSFDMSLRPGSCAQPEASELMGTPVAAPQRGQVVWDASTTAPHQEHFAVPWGCGSGDEATGRGAGGGVAAWGVCGTYAAAAGG